MDDDYQPQGILVRLHSDLMGHAVRLVARRGPEAAAVASAHSKQQRRGRSSSGAVDGLQAGPASVPSSDPAAAEAAALMVEDDGNLAETWQQLELQYGAALTSCVLEDCGGDMRSAVATLKVGKIGFVWLHMFEMTANKRPSHFPNIYQLHPSSPTSPPPLHAGYVLTVCLLPGLCRHGQAHHPPSLPPPSPPCMQDQSRLLGSDQGSAAMDELITLLISLPSPRPACRTSRGCWAPTRALPPWMSSSPGLWGGPDR